MKTNTCFCNLDIITDPPHYDQIENSTFFVRNGNYLLSPLVFARESGAYWIHIRRTNVEPPTY
ncbi:hypothetical protein [Sunxiuqinia rutila]|uniref:hypothetical protein n=1 Tax=Sunxiuqinia rutila TaxID=1397841 RepID=UPI003D36C27F